nr:TonB-dependent receptor [Chryseosolibacter indicus]
MSLEELLNLEITVASKSSEKISDAAGVISVITRDELERFGGITLRDALERVPSLTAIRSYFSEGYGLASRGDQLRINSGHNLILINGRPTREIVEGGISSEMYAAFPLNIIERIEVIRGPGSVLYGSNAFSTVINIITQRNEENNLSARLLSGSNNAKGGSIQGEANLGDLNIVGAARYMDKGDWRAAYRMINFFDPTAGPVSTDSLHADESFGSYLGATYKGLSLTGSYNKFTTTDYQFGPQDDNWSKAFGNLGYNLKANQNWDMSFNVTYNYATFKSGPFPGLTRYSKDLVAEWTNSLAVNQKLKFTFGGLYNSNIGKENMTTFIQQSDMTLTEVSIKITDKSRGSLALYTQADYYLLETLKLIAGVQGNKVDGLDFDLVPRGGVVWYPAKRVNFKALYSQAFRAPSMDEYSMTSTSLNGNPDIRPEKVATMDVGVNYFGEKVQGGVNFFRSTMTDIIAPGTPDQNNLMYYTNKGKVTFKGIEVEGKYYISHALFLTGSMLYQENENEDGITNNSPLANFGAKGGISYRSQKGFIVSLFDIYQGNLDKKYTTGPFSSLNPKAGSYNVLNLYIDADLNKILNLAMKSKLGLFVQGDNILDKEIWGVDWGNSISPGNAIPVNRGRMIYAGLRASLK